MGGGCRAGQPQGRRAPLGKKLLASAIYVNVRPGSYSRIPEWYRRRASLIFLQHSPEEVPYEAPLDSMSYLQSERTRVRDASVGAGSEGRGHPEEVRDDEGPSGDALGVRVHGGGGGGARREGGGGRLAGGSDDGGRGGELLSEAGPNREGDSNDEVVSGVGVGGSLDPGAREGARGRTRPGLPVEERGEVTASGEGGNDEHGRRSGNSTNSQSESWWGRARKWGLPASSRGRTGPWPDWRTCSRSRGGSIPGGSRGYIMCPCLDSRNGTAVL